MASSYDRVLHALETGTTSDLDALRTDLDGLPNGLDPTTAAAG